MAVSKHPMARRASRGAVIMSIAWTEIIAVTGTMAFVLGMLLVVELLARHYTEGRSTPR
jgi:hypothetical protein